MCVRAQWPLRCFALPALAHAETLREALTSAYVEQSQSSCRRCSSVKSTAEDIALAKSAKLPTIDSATASAGIELRRRWRSTVHADPSYNLGVSYNQTLFDNFKTEADIEQARALTEVSATRCATPSRTCCSRWCRPI